MKVTAFYYLDYPDRLPVDRSYASTEMRVEVGEDDTGTIDNFSFTYAFQVYTVKYAEDQFFRARLPLVGRSILIVAELDDSFMSDFLNKNIDRLSEWGEPI